MNDYDDPRDGLPTCREPEESWGSVFGSLLGLILCMILGYALAVAL